MGRGVEENFRNVGYSWCALQTTLPILSPSEKKHYKESNERQITNTEIKKFVSTMQKPIIDKFVETGKKMSSKDSNSPGLKDTDTSLVESSKEDNQVTPLEKALNQDKKITEIPEEKSDIKKDKLTENNYCKLCGKASVMAVECEKCGHMTPKVICDDDLIKGDARLRNPYKPKCENAVE